MSDARQRIGPFTKIIAKQMLPILIEIGHTIWLVYIIAIYIMSARMEWRLSWHCLFLLLGALMVAQ